MFRFGWNINEFRKENIRKKYNKDTDEELFDKLHDEYISAETYIASSWDLIERYKFNSADGTTVSVYDDDAEYSTGRVIKYTINGDYLKIGNDKLYYEKDRIYLVAKSKVNSEISLKVFFVEK